MSVLSHAYNVATRRSVRNAITKFKLMVRLVKICNVFRIYDRYGNMKLQDFFDPAIPSRQDLQDLPNEYRSECVKGVDERRFEYLAVVGHEVLKEAESEREKERWERNHSIKPLSDILNELAPPLTWGEIFFTISPI